jgi:hypothetical protein
MGLQKYANIWPRIGVIWEIAAFKHVYWESFLRDGYRPVVTEAGVCFQKALP